MALTYRERDLEDALRKILREATKFQDVRSAMTLQTTLRQIAGIAKRATEPRP